MAKLQDEIADAFLQKLRKSEEVSLEMVTALGQLLVSKKKLKADDLVKVFSLSAFGEAK